jgi:hypothetical protein
MNILSDGRVLRRGLVTFWAAWWTVVVSTNVTDLLKTFGLLPDTFTWVSNNFAIMRGGAGVADGVPLHVLGLFLFGLAWEGLAAGLFLRAAFGFRGGGEPTGAARAAFTVGISFWAAFLLLCELTVVHAGVPLYLGLLSAHLLSLMAVERGSGSGSS